MHASKFSLIAVFCCIAMIGAVPVGKRAAAEGIARRQGSGVGADVKYVPYYCSYTLGGSNLVKIFHQRTH
jgi:hypothetical protein